VTAETGPTVRVPGLGGGEAQASWPRPFVDRAVEALAVTALVLITVLLLVNALGRYLFSSPLLWAEEVATSLVIWLTMLGMFITARRRELIRVRSFMEKLPPRIQDALDVVTDLISVVSLSYLAWFAISYLQTFGGDTTPFLGLPKGLFTSAIPVGALGLALVVVIDLFQRLRRENP
jgi:TRAP-type C4-dicarboxylate transport system permease small subunit